MNMRFSCIRVALVVSLLKLVHADDVIDFSAKSVNKFKDDLAEYEVALVEFFAPWCGHCKRLAPEYASAATALKKNDPMVPLIKVDCTSDMGKDLCSEFGVSGYPTLKIFKSGEFASEYNGPRDSAGIVKYMRSQVGPASRLLPSYADLNNMLDKANDVVVVGLFDDESDQLYKDLQKASDKLRESVNFAHIFKKSATGEPTDVKLISQEQLTFPSILLVRPKLMKNKFEPSVVVFDKSVSLQSFVTEQYHGLVGHRTQNNMQDFQPPTVVVFYDVDYEKNAKGTNYWRNRVLKVAERVTKAKFAVSNAQQFAGELEEFGLQPVTRHDSPPVVTARNSMGGKFVMTEKFSVESLEKFVNDFLDGKLEPYIKSEEVPEDNSGPVKVAVGKNFDDLVLNTKKDVLIEFYAPWCGHCKKLAPAYEELGKAMQDEPNIEIVKMDATANDVKPPFTVHGFPTIYWYPADTKSARKYEGGREVTDFVEFIAKYASQELKGYTKDGKKKTKEEL